MYHYTGRQEAKRVQVGESCDFTGHPDDLRPILKLFPGIRRFSFSESERYGSNAHDTPAPFTVVVHFHAAPPLFNGRQASIAWGAQ